MNPRGNLQANIRATWTGNDCAGCTDLPSVAEILQGSVNVSAGVPSGVNTHDAGAIALLTEIASKLDAANALLTQIELNTRSE